MKLKELERPAVQAWSPASQYPLYLATGTSAQQLDSSFSTNGTLEIFEVDFRDPSLDLKHKGVLSASSRFHKLIWGSFGNGLLESSGVIAGGGDNGMLILYNVTHILSSGKEPVIAQKQKHTGAVRALDFNPFQVLQGNLLASGASDSEVFIWDLNNLNVPMTLGSKSQYREQPPEDIKALSWNRQAQHILSSAHPSGKAVVWDLRKNELIIKVSDHSNRMHCSGLAWHPDIATQLVLCSEDDRLPVIQLWDLRFASSPLKVLESHSRGILSVSWSQADAELLLTSAKDSQILCWNLESSEVVYKLPTQSSWCFEVQWCPRDPSVFSAASFDGWISLYSVMGRSWEVQHMRLADKISSSFSKGQPLPPLQVPEQVTQASLIPPLKKPPKWIRRPTGVSFAFGGKLVTFGLPSTRLVPQPCPRLVFISQVTTESEFLMRSTELQEALRSGNLLNYCQNKSQQALLQSEKMLWQFLKVTLEQDSRMKFLKLLGYSKDELQKKVAIWLKSDVGLGEGPQPKGNDLNSDRQQAFCSQASKHTTEEASASSAFFDELVPQNMTPWEIPITKDVDGLLSQALLLGELGPAVELCLKEERFADAIILAQAGGADLLKQTQERYLAMKKTKISSLLACVVQKNWKDVVCTCSLKNWREALALLLTYSSTEKFPELCDMLGTRMEQEGGRALTSEARLCYVCSGSVERLVECSEKCHQALSPMALQDLMEKVMVLNRSLELLWGPHGVSPGPATTYRVTQYANLLAAQGSLATAMSFLPSDCAQPPVQQLRDRLFRAQGSAVLGQQSPPFPYPRIVVGAIPHSKETSYRLGSQPSHQVPTPSPRPRVFTPQSSPAMPLAPSHPSPYQGPRMQNISHYRAPGSQAVQPLPLGPGVRPASSQPQLLGGQRVQAPNPVGFPGTWPLPGSPLLMACPDITQPGSTSLPETPRLFPLLPLRPPGPGHMVSHAPAPPVSFPVPYPPGGPGAPCSSVLPTTGILTPHPGPQDSWKEAPAPRGNLQRNKLPETFMPPAPITAPVMSLTPELQGILPSQPPVSGVSHAPPGAPGELSLQQLQHLPPKKMERKELPPEHQSLKSSFEALLQRCSLSATDLKTKRKLEEAAQRLECLYEKLCEGTLSPHVVAGLHEVARCVDAGSFEQGLAVHAQVAGCSSFSEVSSFMPILKAVLIIAHKLLV
ncbi:protein transport protein Sec31B isoform X1 [Trachypithecus francoisi]|uniref:protein transport protein Sec31B isoform X1 n=2 Tax=Trachypithecus francoisi TaxID=54180 RepID=UPI00141B8C49|nr:protein transport protein Sec31B isoform X1 [Trachypithecus francoisi]XP_033041379.1 protein transport protein Sec31B isoform X1 [Trachypithecus francoisi]XP_033041383.1 protein transport protein Sec31B isoform X1 [Trachypithecus francoisi]XP_033041390.1 protein transport protein Sec31B isoform X1 [Trachypithecus francoisi]XP_033041404.1 protein transport protein Sec31B isoform X1 [Trachypithecus francoisi]XP_033041410.1 protein transport protein Sec31B isoform X1 [Trachypithecus francoisi]